MINVLYLILLANANFFYKDRTDCNLLQVMGVADVGRAATSNAYRK